MFIACMYEILKEYVLNNGIGYSRKNKIKGNINKGFFKYTDMSKNPTFLPTDVLVAENIHFLSLWGFLL